MMLFWEFIKMLLLKNGTIGRWRQKKILLSSEKGKWAILDINLTEQLHLYCHFQ